MPIGLLGALPSSFSSVLLSVDVVIFILPFVLFGRTVPEGLRDSLLQCTFSDNWVNYGLAMKKS